MTTKSQQFPETELIITPSKKVYHINLGPEDIADNVLVVGDQGRVDKISRFFSKVEFTTQHREFITHTGIYNGTRLTVLSTGIGTDNIDIVLNELDAAVNIDLESRSERTIKRSLNIIRLGTSGALQEDIPVNSLVVSSHGLGFDGLLNYYKGALDKSEKELSDAFIKHSDWANELPYPYCFKCDSNLYSKFINGNFGGITATAPGFYGPQGRRLRLEPLILDLNERMTSFRFHEHRISNFEMETSALYGLGQMLGHNCLTVCVIIANRVKKEFTGDYNKSVEHLIGQSLDILSSSK